MLGTGCSADTMPRGAGSLSREQQASGQRPSASRSGSWGGQEGLLLKEPVPRSGWKLLGKGHTAYSSLCQGLEAETARRVEDQQEGMSWDWWAVGRSHRPRDRVRVVGLVLGGRTNTCGAERETSPPVVPPKPTGQAPWQTSPTVVFRIHGRVPAS